MELRKFLTDNSAKSLRNYHFSKTVRLIIFRYLKKKNV